jgi:hypothetical protein
MSSLSILLGLIDGASPAELQAMLPPEARGDISCAFAIDYGTPGHTRRLLRQWVKREHNKGRAQRLHEAWMARLSKAGTEATRAGRPMPAMKK